MILTTYISMPSKGRKTEHSRFKGKEVMHRSTMLSTYFIQSISTSPMFHPPHFRDLGSYINLMHFAIYLPVCPKMAESIVENRNFSGETCIGSLTKNTQIQKDPATNLSLSWFTASFLHPYSSLCHPLQCIESGVLWRRRHTENEERYQFSYQCK